MKLLVLASTLDLRHRLGSTPSWWLLLKAFHETGHEVIAVPYLGDPVESLWWRTYENPCSFESRLFNTISKWNHRALNDQWGVSGRMSKFWIERHVRPRWSRHVAEILANEKDVGAVLVMNIPVNHFAGISEYVREEFGVPVAYYDGDMPTSLPGHGGYRFNYYDGVDLAEYDLFFTNSRGSIPDLEAMGARRVRTLYWAAEPDLCRPVEAAKEFDVSFFGFGSQFREEWMTKLISVPSERLPRVRFVVGGNGFEIPLGRAERAGEVPYSAFGQFVGRSKINLNITRRGHTSVYASATARPFELAAYAACIVSQPYNGIEEWFQVGKELLVAKDEDHACELYGWLLDDEATAREFGRRARERVLREHTFRHRANEVVAAFRSLP